jgi:hypothetical protein
MTLSIRLHIGRIRGCGNGLCLERHIVVVFGSLNPFTYLEDHQLYLYCSQIIDNLHARRDGVISRCNLY